MLLTLTYGPCRNSAANLCRRWTGDVLYMPTALPGLSVRKAAELLQQTDRLIKTVPEVASVFGKARCNTATDRRWKCSRRPFNSNRATNGDQE
jgi:hypothetical protein